MKEKILIIEDYSSANKEQVEDCLDKIILTEELDLTIRWKFYGQKLDKKILFSLAELIRKRGMKKEFSIIAAIETDQWKAVGNLKNVLNQLGFSVDLAVSPFLREDMVLRLQKKMLLEHVIVDAPDYPSLRKICDPYWKAGVPVITRGCELSLEEYISWFDQWTENPKGGWVDQFLDMVSYIYTGTHIADCCHDSCLGKYLYIDEKGNLYFCGKKKENSSMGGSASGNLYDDSYTDTLRQSIQKRKKCKEACQGFDCCQGGCPLEEDSPADCGDYLKKLSYVRNYILENRENLFADVANPGLRQLFLSAAAFGFCM